jgi:predicted alpha/beta-hydrolase family hydrolase
MGGRIAAMLSAEPTVDWDGVVVYGFPLRPPGPSKKTAERGEVLRAVRRPCLVLQGEKDTFGGPADLEPYRNRATTVVGLPGIDHAMVRRRHEGEGLDALAERTTAWLDELIARARTN